MGARAAIVALAAAGGCVVAARPTLQAPRPAPARAGESVPLGTWDVDRGTNAPRVRLECVGDGAEGTGPEADVLVRGAVTRALLDAGVQPVDGPGVEAVVRVEWSLRYLYTRAMYGMQYDFFQPAVGVRVLAPDTGLTLHARAMDGPATARPASLARVAAGLAAEAVRFVRRAWARPPAPLAVDGRLFVEGRVGEPGVRVRVNGHEVAVDADGRFRAAVEGDGPIRVEATDASGHTVVREVRP